jgi:pSer/pThr/pTyr-binding forkhead associated (FHA) protein
MMIQNVPQDGIKLGRGHDCEIRITDISVSRNHAMIKFHNGSFHIFDNKSKFGTLVKEERMEVAVTPDHAQAIQIGRTVVILELKKESDLKERAKTSRANVDKI